MAIRTTESIVLKTQVFRNSSLIAHLFTRDFGKIQGLAKAILARTTKKGSRFNSFLQPLTLNRVVYYEKARSQLYTITQCELIDQFQPIRQDLKKIAAASYLVELIDRCAQLQDTSQPLFDLLAETLRVLCEEKRPEAILRVFEIKFLGILGFMPQIRMCIDCGKTDLQEARFSPRAGGILCAECSKMDRGSTLVSKGAIASMLHIWSDGWEGIKRFRFARRVEEELAPVLGEFIKMHVCDNLKSMEFMEKLSKMTND